MHRNTLTPTTKIVFGQYYFQNVSCTLPRNGEFIGLILSPAFSYFLQCYLAEAVCPEGAFSRTFFSSTCVLFHHCFPQSLLLISSN